MTLKTSARRCNTPVSCKFQQEDLQAPSAGTHCESPGVQALQDAPHLWQRRMEGTRG